MRRPHLGAALRALPSASPLPQVCESMRFPVESLGVTQSLVNTAYAVSGLVWASFFSAVRLSMCAGAYG